MDNNSIQRIRESLQRSNSIAVTVGSNPNIDQMGAALALYLSLQEMGKNVSVLAGTEPIVELSNLVGIDKVKISYEAGGADLVVSFPYREGEIEKVSYTIENSYLNIVVKAGEQGLNFSEQDVKYSHGGGGQLDLLFVIGTANLSEIQPIFGTEALRNVTVINIDNNKDNQGYGDIVVVSPKASSVSEQVAQILSDLKTPVNSDIAQNLLDGIIFGTNNFQNPRITFLAFEMAGILMRQGAIRSKSEASYIRPQSIVQNQMPQQQPRKQQQNFDRDRKQQQPEQRRQIQQHQQPQRDQQQQQQNFRQQDQRQQNQQSQQPESLDDGNPPNDWLTPKVYKGSSNV